MERGTLTSEQNVTVDHGGFPFVSVIVPTANRSGTLAECVGSLVAQDYPADMFEIVLVVNGPAGKGRARAEALPMRSAPPALRVLSLRRRDANPARNAGVRAARGDPICFVDDDVVAPSGWLAALTGGVSRHPDAGCLGGPIRARFEASIPRTCPAHVAAGTEFDRGDSEAEVTDPAQKLAREMVRELAHGIGAACTRGLRKLPGAWASWWRAP